jgi:hypothetical protein
MKNSAKYLFTLIFLTGSLLLGLEASNNFATAFDGPTRGYVCTEQVGLCAKNWNATTCTWGPNDVCETNNANDPGTSP